VSEQAGARPRIAVVDYGAGNLVSIEQALTSVGAAVTVARDAGALGGVDALVVPGVGAAAPAMARLERRGLVDPIRDWIERDRPFLGICLGLQLLFDGSDEDGATTLGVLPGRTSRLENAPTLPHIGWNQVVRTREHPLFDGIADGADLYFVHSFAGVPAAGAGDVVLARTEHGRPFVSAVARGRLLGVQFHPERSGTDGLRLLANFVGLVRAGVTAAAGVAA
jgi:imidazole glycerol phosphate synthase glutamine amidotransferase subunit